MIFATCKGYAKNVIIRSRAVRPIDRNYYEQRISNTRQARRLQRYVKFSKLKLYGKASTNYRTRQ